MDVLHLLLLLLLFIVHPPFPSLSLPLRPEQILVVDLFRPLLQGAQTGERARLVRTFLLSSNIQYEHSHGGTIEIGNATAH